MRRIRYIQKWMLVFMIMVTSLPGIAADDTRNYVLTVEPLVAGSTTGRTTVAYFDGLEQLNFGGLGWYDNHARWYDPVSMRFTTPNPLAWSFTQIASSKH